MNAALLLWSLLSVLTLVVAVVHWRLSRRIEKLRLTIADQAEQLLRLQRELTLVSETAVGVGQQLIAAERKFAASVARPAPAFDFDDQQPLGRAQQLAQQGADVRQLVEQCGISEAEARLMRLMAGRTAVR